MRIGSQMIVTIMTHLRVCFRNVLKFSKTFKKSDITSDQVDANLAEVVNEAFRRGHG